MSESLIALRITHLAPPIRWTESAGEAVSKRHTSGGKEVTRILQEPPRIRAALTAPALMSLHASSKKRTAGRAPFHLHWQDPSSNSSWFSERWEGCGYDAPGMDTKRLPDPFGSLFWIRDICNRSPLAEALISNLVASLAWHATRKLAPREQSRGERPDCWSGLDTTHGFSCRR
ncbi:hypothetical protein LIA77_04714 [Sarocladium implicatum]|jgi:hypothetical protein|nr:hypothetical protein LIA77_04714 [Sarocladium implicatum]